MELSAWGRRGRTALKRFLYAQLMVRDAVLIGLGRGKPLVRFKVEASPPSLYFNFAVLPERLDELERALGLPHPIRPISCLEGEAPFHCLTLNAYRVSGLANGIRAEWSTYVSPDGGPPRYLNVEAQTERYSLDPVQLLVRPGPISYTETASRLVVSVGSDDGGVFNAWLPRSHDSPLVRSDPAWVCANDYIYWRNGVCDRTFYDAGLADASIREVDPMQVEIVNDTSWVRYIDPVPRSVVLFDDAIEFAMSPWWNIDDTRS